MQHTGMMQRTWMRIFWFFVARGRSFISFSSNLIKYVGPVFVLLASCLISYVVYAYFFFVLPMAVGRRNLYGATWCANVAVGLFLLFNIVFNYAMCVSSNSGTHESPMYHKLLAEARSAGFVPEAVSKTVWPPTEVVKSGKPPSVSGLRGRRPSPSGMPFETGFTKESIMEKPSHIDKAPAEEETGETETDNLLGQKSKQKWQAKSWMDMGPNEWGICRRTGLPKPPRAHYDSVTGKLVMNMDHYCPWMANAVGYGNYRYFFLFLLYMYLGTLYTSSLAIGPFLELRDLRRSAESEYLSHRYRYQQPVAAYSAAEYEHTLSRDDHNPHHHRRHTHKDGHRLRPPTGYSSMQAYYHDHPEVGAQLGRPEELLDGHFRNSDNNGALLRTRTQLLTDLEQTGLSLSAAAGAPADGAGADSAAARAVRRPHALRGSHSIPLRPPRSSSSTSSSALSRQRRRLPEGQQEHEAALRAQRHEQYQRYRYERYQREAERGIGWSQLQREASSHVLFFFVLTIAVAMAVFTLLSLHIHLLLTAQTTIEISGNKTIAKKWKKEGKKWKNPYDKGWKRNWQAVFGKQFILLAILPSTRPPPWPPWPQHRAAVGMGKAAEALLSI